MRAMDLQVREVTKEFRSGPRTVPVLAGISFEVAAGDGLAITGPSGAGKSTLLHIIGTLEPPSSGSLSIGGTDVFDLDEPTLARFRNGNVGFVFQDHHLLPQYTVLENAVIPAMAFSGGQADPHARARTLLQRVGLGHRLDHRPAELSGGERQRVAIARALINRPALVLCDEPTGDLDTSTANSVADLLQELHADEQNILIVVTHSMGLAARFGRRFDLRDGLCSAA